MKFDVVGMGHPILDVTTQVEDSFLENHHLKKGEMHLIDEDKSKELLDLFSSMNLKSTAGGSAANTLACITTLGASTILIGKVGDDKLGEKYLELAKEDGIWSGCKTHFLPQGICNVFTTSDGERTFATFLGASQTLETDNVDFSHFLDAKILHVEGYLLDSAKHTVFDVIKHAKEKGVLVSFDLSDVGIIERHREDIHLLMKFVDIIFANETEVQEFTSISPEESVNVLSEIVPIVAVKLGPHGSIISKDRVISSIPAFKVDVKNSNGAGDAYAGGFLWALLNNYDLETIGKVAAYCGAQAVASNGARIENKSLKEDIDKLIN